MDLVAGAVKKTGVDEGDAGFRGADTFFQVHRGAAFFVHDAEFHRVTRQAEDLFDAVKGFCGEGHLFRPVHFRFHHIDRALGRVAQPVGLAQVVAGDQRGQHRVHQAFGHFRPIGQQDGRVGHQVAHVAHPQKRTALDGQRSTVRSCIGPVGVQAAF